MFTVEEKGGAQRLILDARGPNMLFHRPPKVKLCSSEALSRMEVSLGKDPAEITADDLEWVRGLQAFVGVADVDNCFHRLRIPRALAEYFCLMMMSYSSFSL